MEKQNRKTNMKNSSLMCGVAIVSLLAWHEVSAQESKKEEIRVKVIREKDGKTVVEEKVISADGMSSEERNRRLDIAVDTLTKGPKKRVKVIVEDGKEAEIRWEESDDELILREPRGERRMLFEWDSREFKNQMKRLGDELPRRIDMYGPTYRWDNQLFRDWGQSPFRGVEVYPNKPSNEVLNVRFFAENEGDVTVRVLDIQGKEVAFEVIKNHQGEYIGQIKIKRANSGTYFVLLTQGNDGVSRRIVLEGN